MRKILLLLFIPALLLCGCSAQPQQGAAYFSGKAEIGFNGSSYSAAVVYNANGIEVDVLDTAAAGLRFVYDGASLLFGYSGIRLAQADKGLEPSNPAIALYDALSAAKNSESSSMFTVDGGFLINGKTPLGAFELRLSQDMEPQSLIFENNALTMEFE